MGVALVAGPACARDIYSWKSEDGGIAFTDDAKAIPARYRDAVQVRKSADLSGYRHLTPTDAAASERYAEGLAARVERLRALNDQLARAPRRPGANAAPSDGSVVIRTGDTNGPGVNVTAGAASDEPIVVKNVVVLPDGGAATQHAQVVRQGGRVVSIVMGTPNEWDSGSVVEASELLHSAE